LSIPLPDRFNASLLATRGRLNSCGETVGASELAIFDRPGDELVLRAETDAAALLMAGQPIDEPIVGAGSFVMNSEDELRETYADFRAGRF
jgi:hypothetical protein